MRIISGSARGTKLYTLEGTATRPTLDRVKEPLFSIIQWNIKDSVILDSFAGSGALALEALSRGAKKAILWDKSYEAIEIIKKNIEKTHLEDKTKILCMDYKKCLASVNGKFDLIFIDPPYKYDIAVNAVEIILENKTKVLCMDYKKCLDNIEEKLDLIFIDPPYKLNIAVKAIEIILQKQLLSEGGLIILETDDEERELQEIKNLNYNIKIINIRTYGRVKLIFLQEEKRGWRWKYLHC